MQITPIPHSTQPIQRPDLMQAAQKLEAQFLSMMLESAGLNEMPSLTGGGTGEDQFASMMRDQQAEAMVRGGGIGLAETIYAAMVRHAG